MTFLAIQLRAVVQILLLDGGLRGKEALVSFYLSGMPDIKPELPGSSLCFLHMPGWNAPGYAQSYSSAHGHTTKE